MTNDALSTVSRFVASHYPTADAAMLAGSRSRGEESSSASHGRTMKASISNSPDRKKLKNLTFLYLHVSHRLISTRYS